MIDIRVPLPTTIIVANLSVVKIGVVATIITSMIKTILIEICVSPYSVVFISAVPLCRTEKKAACVSSIVRYIKLCANTVHIYNLFSTAHTRDSFYTSYIILFT